MAILGAGSNSPSIEIGAVIVFFVNWLATIILTYILLAGLMLPFPAAAVEDDAVGFKAGWKMAKGNRWRMFSTILIGTAIPSVVLQLLFAFVIEGIGFVRASGGELSLTIQFISDLVGQAVAYLGIAIGVSILSIMYRRMRDNVPLEPKESA